MSGLATGFGLRGDNPKAPIYKKVDVGAEAQRALDANLSMLPDAAKLGAQTQEALTSQLITTLNQLIPNWSQISGNVSKNIESLSRGELPQDVQNLIGRQAAEMGITTGTSGSDFDKYRSLRNLGLTSLQATDQALNSAARWMQTVMSGAPKFDFTRSFISPELQVQSTFRNNENQYKADWLTNQIDALPSNWERAGAQALDYVATVATQALGMGMGGMGGGGAGQTSQPAQPYNSSEMAAIYQRYGGY